MEQNTAIYLSAAAAGRARRGWRCGIPGISHQTSEIPGAAWRDQKEFSNFALIIIRAGGVCPDCDLSQPRDAFQRQVGLAGRRARTRAKKPGRI